MDKKQKEALVLALLEKRETYRDIARKAGVSPNTIKAIANKSGLDETTSISSRAFELFSEGKTPLEVAIKLNLEAEKAIQYHQQYYMLLGCTEFTRVYLQIKDNPWPYVNLANLVHSSLMGDREVAELLKIANGHLPRVRLEYDRLNWEKNSLRNELNAWKFEIDHTVRIYQNFCDRNLKLKNREDELLLSISELEAKKSELATAELQHPAEVQENNLYNDNLNLEIEQEDVIFTTDIFIPPSNMAVNYHQNEDEMHHYHSQVEPSSRKLILDTRDLFRYQQE
ncbi:MAG: helix-turn-helix domain-containing protein [Nitrososphaeraceae archaeon]